MHRKPVYHYVPEEETFEKRLVERLENCREAILASAFFTNRAYKSLKGALESALVNKVRIIFLLGRFDFVTEPRAVGNLLKLGSKYPGRVKVFFDADFEFHYKLALLKDWKNQVVFIGSSNLTPKGLSAIGEVNLEIVNNISVFSQAKEILDQRLRSAIPAEEHPNAYRRNYNRAKKYRRQRRRWENLGRRKLTIKRQRTSATWHRPEGDVFTFCWIGEDESDKVLKDNIRKVHKKEVTREEHFPYQWVHWGKSGERLFQEGRDFVVRNDLANTFGFAVCTRKIRVLDSRNRKELVVFYRFHRGWRAKSKKKKYERILKGLRLNSNHLKIKYTLSQRLKNYFKRSHLRQIRTKR